MLLRIFVDDDAYTFWWQEIRGNYSLVTFLTISRF